MSVLTPSPLRAGIFAEEDWLELERLARKEIAF